MDDDLEELLAEAENIIANPDTTVYQPLIMLRLLVALAREFQHART